MQTLISLENASRIASMYTGKKVTESNISYLIQYGRIDRYLLDGSIAVCEEQVKKYYDSYLGKKEMEWKSVLGDDLNWQLSFDGYKEAETTKHVHRLHPYKGKYIPQLVEYFLDDHIDEFKKEVFFKKGDIVLDPFCGSGTTLVQANELGMHAIGVDISKFNALISNCKVSSYNVDYLEKIVMRITDKLIDFERELGETNFEEELLAALYNFNSMWFPSPEYKKKVYRKEIDEDTYGNARASEFLPTFVELAQKYSINIPNGEGSFLEKWYFETARKEICFINQLISMVSDEKTNELLKVILSRTMRSCRATTHSDLATLIKPVYTTYYCSKHKKICKPLFSVLKWWKTYSKDTIRRIAEFDKVRTNTAQICFNDDSTSIDLERLILQHGGALSETYHAKKVRGIFSSPPYVGLIDYHEQHAYAYEIFGFDRLDNKEIGSMFSGYSKDAQNKYVEGIAQVLINAKQCLTKEYEVFLVANDKFNLYPRIAALSGMQIVEEFKRPVLNRTEKDKRAYSEVIFRMKEKA